jgi:hypothetical protein
MPPLTPDDPEALEISCAGCGTTGLVSRASLSPEMLADGGVFICEDCAPQAEEILAEVATGAQVTPDGEAMVQVPPDGGLPTVREIGELAVAFARACQLDDMTASFELYHSLSRDTRTGLTIFLGRLVARLVNDDPDLWEALRQWPASLPDTPPPGEEQP